MTTRLDISIGPVQGFVAQSRRTRDLWGSSYLLSFLSAHAMYGARKAGGRVVRPIVDEDPLYRWIAGPGEGEAPRLGTLPNHFVVEVDGEAPEVARTSVQALEEAWQQVCGAVWKRFVERACPSGHGTACIWSRQIHGFWEVMWTAGTQGATAGSHALLARRKHWRSHRLPDEPGDKCTVMHDLQEISGYVRAEGSESRKNQDDFWEHLCKHLGPLDLRDNERLCAIALVKRLFPKVAAEALGWKVDTSHWPSTVYVGAVPWIRRAVSIAPQQTRQYAEAVRRNAAHTLSERHPPFAGLDDAASGDFPKLDANYLHREFVKTERLCPLPGDTDNSARGDLLRRLETIHDARDGIGRRLGAPPTFYALLLADGDHLGKLVSRMGGGPVGRALADFTCDVSGIVNAHDGVTVYAGGDDVLAMLPVPGALSCAASLASRYQSAFGERDAEIGATLSASVVFAHVRLPLSAAIAEAHRLLDDVAKEENGRGSLAAGVMKRSGSYCRWVTTWNRMHPDGGSSPASELLERLIRHLKRDVADPDLSSTLIYRLREMLTTLCGWQHWKPGAWGRVPEDLDLRTFLHAEIIHGLERSSFENDEDHAGELTDLVCELLRPSRTRGTEVTEAGVDALLLARFLTAPAREEDDG